MERKCSNEPFQVLMRTSKAIQDQIRDQMNQNDLSITEFSVLEVLYHKEKQTIHQIGNSVLISSGSMTYVIDKLEQRGLLNRSPCHNDRRVVHVTLTDDGNNLMKKIMPKQQQLVDDIFSSLTDTEAKLLVNLLIRVNKKALS